MINVIQTMILDFFDFHSHIYGGGEDLGPICLHYE